MKCFIWIFLLPLKYGVFGADEKKAVTEGDHLTLQTGFSEIQGNDRIVWLYGSVIIARIDKASGVFDTYDVDDGRFSGKLELDKQTGSLIIKDIRIKNAGDYQLEKKGVTAGKFIVTVYARLPTPDIGFSDCPQTPAGSSKICAVQCSVQTVGLVTLSWYKGNNLVSSKASDTCSIISLRLEVDYDDKNIYSCTVNNPISNQTKHLDISGLCHKCAAVPDKGFSGAAVAGIVIGVLLLLVAAVAGVIYFLCPRITNLPSQTWSVPHGDYVTLKPETEIQTGDEIQWLFGDKDALIAEIKGEDREMKTYDGPGEIFMFRLKLETTGSLTIEYITTEHTGLYTLKIRRGRKTFYKRFNVSVEKRMRRLVKEGDPVFLNPDKEKEKDDEVQWLFGDEEQTVLGEIKNTEVTKYTGPDERFRDRLKLNENTGSLTITDITTEHTGRYTMKITRGREKIYNKFYISVGESEITVMEGEPVTLNPAYDVNKDDLIQWLFGDEALQTLIAEFNGKTGKILTYDDVADGRFRDRLELDETTGDLTINNMRTAHTGVYKLQIFSSSGVTEQIFIVTVKYKVEKILLTGGDSVTLKPDTEIQREDQILWMFGDLDKLIAQIRGGTIETYDDVNKRFRGRLKLDKTGSLTVKEIEAEHMGLYKVQIISNSRGTLYKRFKVLIPLRYETMTVGEPVRLYTPYPENQTFEEIQWRFGDENALIAEIKGGTVKTHDVPDERFRDRLELNEKTGDLTINNSTYEHAGLYRLKIRNSKGNKYRIYSVIIRDAAVTKEAREKSLMKEKSDSRGKRENDSATVVMPLLNGEDPDGGNEEGMSSL